MKLNLVKPIIFFDLETTGTDFSKDRIVEICYIKVWPDGKEVASPSPSLEFENINNIPVHCNEILRQKAMECAIICQASF